MASIEQTFYVNQPANGVAGLFITKLDIYFQSVSSTYGIELQIRTTENGYPTQERLPFASKVLLVNDALNPPTASNDASIPTTFIFDTPVFVQSNVSYAIVLIPIGGNPDYNVWTGVIGETDVTTNTPIYTNNNTGDLFLSSNDIDSIPVITEDMKFTIYSAEFSSLTGTAIFNNIDQEFARLKYVAGGFIKGETVLPANTPLNLTVLNIANTVGTFAVNNFIYQANSTANNAGGVIYAANSTVLKIRNTLGSGFNTTNKIYNTNSTSNAVVTSVFTNSSSTASSNVVNIPDSSIFSVNNVIYISTNNNRKNQIVSITSIPSSTTIQVNTEIAFTSNNINYGFISYNGTVSGTLVSSSKTQNLNTIIQDIKVSASNNFITPFPTKLIGSSSGSSSLLNGLVDIPYGQLTPLLNNIVPANTELGWGIEGFANNISYTPDGSYISVSSGITNEFIDIERVLMSRSSEFTNLPTGRKGNKSLTLAANFVSSNNLISPSIDTMSEAVVVTTNRCLPISQISGYYFNVNQNGNRVRNFNTGDTITQGNTVGTINSSNGTSITVTNVSNGSFTIGNIYDPVTNVFANVTSSEYFSECKENPNLNGSRYISKNIILSSTQTSEDILVYLSAYRPSTTNLLVYARVINSQDSDTFNTKDFSFLPETSSPSLLSSQIDVNDRVELSYAFPSSQQLFANSISCNTSSNTVFVPSTTNLTFNNYVYIFDNVNNKYNVRRITNVINSTAISVETIPSFTSTNSILGIIPGLQSRSSAFLNDQNSNIVRYVTNSDLVYDTYSQFAIKIVPVSNTRILVPRVGDLRVLALS